MPAFETVEHEVDFCVVGGGIAGLCAALAAARHGLKVALMQDRPMLGGNASSEIRMWICGAHGEGNRETGILEELTLENQYRNPLKNYSIWDSVLYGIARSEKNVILLLNCSCLDAKMDKERIVSICGWQTTTQRYHRVKAKLFADCSGDSILAPLTGAQFRMGRESRKEFDESITPEQADSKTMGMNCLMQAEEMPFDVPYTAPRWSECVTKEKLTYRMPDMSDVRENFWYLELGGQRNSIADTEELRDELLALNYGFWDYIKNDPEQKEKHARWALSWMGMLPGKRESRRYVGAYILTERDIEQGGHFEDIVAYGGWTMDDHHPSGFRTKDRPNVFHPAPSPYGIPYRCLYSVNIQNLFFAGRNISVTHAAFSSIRVMATCALCGQAAGTAAALAIHAGVMPSQVSVNRLQAELMRDDCYLPGKIRTIPKMTRDAALSGGGQNVQAVRDGIDRNLKGETHAWIGMRGDVLRYDFSSPVDVAGIRLVFDSDLERETFTEEEQIIGTAMFCNRRLVTPLAHPPKTLIRRFRIKGIFADRREVFLLEEKENYQRFRVYEMCHTGLTSIIFEPLETWGADDFRVFGFEVE